MKIKRIVVGSLETNCYIINSDNEIAIIDPGGEPDKILNSVLEAADGETAEIFSKSSRELKFVAATHCHWDHIGALDQLKEKLNFPFYIGRGELSVLKNSTATETFPDRELENGDQLTLGKSKLEILSTPGHSPGSITFIDRQAKKLIVGDLIFSGGYGRTDLPGGSKEKLKKSIKKLAGLGGNWEILPGHGPETSLEREKRRSPFLKKSREDR